MRDEKRYESHLAPIAFRPALTCTHYGRASQRVSSINYLTFEYRCAMMNITSRRALREWGRPTFWDIQRWWNRCSWPVRCAGKPEKFVRLSAAHHVMGCAVFVYPAKNPRGRETDAAFEGTGYEYKYRSVPLKIQHMTMPLEKIVLRCANRHTKFMSADW